MVIRACRRRHKFRSLSNSYSAKSCAIICSWSHWIQSWLSLTTDRCWATRLCKLCRTHHRNICWQYFTLRLKVWCLFFYRSHSKSFELVTRFTSYRLFFLWICVFFRVKSVALIIWSLEFAFICHLVLIILLYILNFLFTNQKFVNDLLFIDRSRISWFYWCYLIIILKFVIYTLII